MPRWSAAQMLSRIAPLGKPLKLTEWPSDMGDQILPAQLKLHEAIVQRRITDVRGRLGPPGSKERIEELLRDSELTLLVTPHGTLTIHPTHKRRKFEEKYRIDFDNWVREIDFDQDESEQAFSAALAPCQRQPDRSHLRLVSGARNGETEESMPEPEPELAKAEHAALKPIELATTEPAPTELPVVLSARGSEPSPAQSSETRLPATQPNERMVAEPLADSAKPAAAPHPGGRPGSSARMDGQRGEVRPTNQSPGARLLHERSMFGVARRLVPPFAQYR